MSMLFPPKKIVISLVLLMTVAVIGCTHYTTSRGHLVRGDWAIEYNRTPWIGCPADSGCPESDYQNVCNDPHSKGLLACLTQDNEGRRNRTGCRTPGYGMWGNVPDGTLPDSMSRPARACGLTPYCCPQKPCGLTPGCGKPANINVSPQTIFMPDQHAAGGLGSAMGRGITMNNMPNGMMTGGMGTVRGMSPDGVMSSGVLSANGTVANGTIANGTVANGTIANGTIVNGTMIAGVPGALVSRGIVPGASQITTGGMVAAIGVATPAGTMTHSGVRLPNGMVNNNLVLRACMMNPNCTAAHPCGLTQYCGGAVAANLVANNAAVLASKLHAQGIASGVIQAGGGMLVNPMTNQPINGVTMSGYSQMGYPPIGYAPTGYAPGYPRYAAGMIDTGQMQEEPEEEEEETQDTIQPGTRSKMPVPRFHPMPTNPMFQRREGMSSTPQQQRTGAKPDAVSMTEQPEFSEKELEAALDQAYLEGVSAAMNEVERKLEAKRQAAARAKLQEQILQQSEYFQRQLDEQERVQQLAVHRAEQERQLRQSAAARSSQTQNSAVRGNTTSSTNVNSLQLAAESLKTSVTNSMNDLFTASPKTQPPMLPKPASQSAAKPKAAAKTTEIAVTPPALPGRPPVLPVTREYGLQPYDEYDGIVQTQFTDDDTLVRP